MVASTAAHEHLSTDRVAKRGVIKRRCRMSDASSVPDLHMLVSRYFGGV